MPKQKPQQTGARFMALVAQLIHKGIEQNKFYSECALDAITNRATNNSYIQ